MSTHLDALEQHRAMIAAAKAAKDLRLRPNGRGAESRKKHRAGRAARLALRAERNKFKRPAILDMLPTR